MKLLINIGIGCVLLVSLAQAEVYVWQDASGHTQYSDQVPPKVKARKLNVRPISPAPPATANASAPIEMGKPPATTASKVPPNPSTNNARINEANIKIREQNCQNARNNLSSLQQNSRILLPGTNAMATDAQRATLLQQAQGDIHMWCEAK